MPARSSHPLPGKWLYSHMTLIWKLMVLWIMLMMLSFTKPTMTTCWEIWMDYYGVKTEAEIFGGNIMKMSKSLGKQRDSDAINAAVRSLRKEARTWFNDGDGDDAYAKASAWYYVTYHPDYYGLYNEGMNRAIF
ncbi:putative RNA-dependent RNA polymerase [Arachis hypogaea]|nr:putative RNA-dependent RNA polymerase [Arachis hypogaea]